VYLDKASKELVVKVVFAGDGKAALEAASSLAAQAKVGTASPVVPLLEGSVRTFTQRMPRIQVRGFALRIEVVAVALHQLHAAFDASQAAASEKEVVTCDALVPRARRRGQPRCRHHVRTRAFDCPRPWSERHEDADCRDRKRDVACERARARQRDDCGGTSRRRICASGGRQVIAGDRHDRHRN
jgi:hypothetical protein